VRLAILPVRDVPNIDSMDKPEVAGDDRDGISTATATVGGIGSGRVMLRVFVFIFLFIPLDRVLASMSGTVLVSGVILRYPLPLSLL